MKFDIKNYPGKYVMHCQTEEHARIFCDYLHSLGKKWACSGSYKDSTYWNVYKNHTCYNFNDDLRCNYDYYAENSFSILFF